MNRREEILSKIGFVPSLPPAAVDAMRLLQNPDVDIRDLLRAIEYDPWLTSNLLRVANSAYFGGTGWISSVRDALVRLGTKCVFQMIVASATTPLLKPAIKGYDLPPGELWRHSVAVAIGTEQIAKILNLRPADFAFTAGLLHDIGKIVLGTFVEVDAAPILKLAYEKGVPFEAAEECLLGINHPEAGAVLLDSWNLPHCVAEVCRWHHQPENFKGDTLVVDLVHTADILCLMGGIGLGSDGLNYRPSGEVAARLKLTTLAAETAVCGISNSLNEMRELFTPGAAKRSA